MCQARRLDYLESSEELFEDSVCEILDRGGFAGAQRKSESALDSLSMALASHRYARAFRNRHPVPLEEILVNIGWPATLNIEQQLTTHTESYRSHKQCLEVSRVAEEESKRSGREWAAAIGPWDRVAEAARSLWGNRWTISVFAATASGIRSGSEKCQDFEDLFDSSKSLCRRARYARLKSGVPSWWKKQFQQAESVEDALFVSLLCATWATTHTLCMLLDTFENALKGLPLWQWLKLRVGVRRVKHFARFDDDGDSIDVTSLPETLSEKLVSILASRADEESRHQIFRKYLESSSGKDIETLELIAQEAEDRQRLGTSSWNPNLKAIQRCYESGYSFGFSILEGNLHREQVMPGNIAARIMESADRYPGAWLRLAEDRCRREVAQNILPVTRISERDRWFA